MNLQSLEKLNNMKKILNISKEEKSHKKMVGQIQGGGYYFCDASYPEFIVVKS